MMKRKMMTDDDIIKWISQFETRAEMREADWSIYLMALKRGLKDHFPKAIPRCKYTDDYLIKWISNFETVTELRKSDNNMYSICLKRGLQSYLPESMREKMKREGVEIPRGGRGRPKGAKNKIKDGIIKTYSQIYEGEKYEDGSIICGRCLEWKEKSQKNCAALCPKCFTRVQVCIAMGKEHNRWNVRDAYCNTVIKHYDKEFHIGIKVDERTKQYLTLIGYGFIFKEDNIK